LKLEKKPLSTEVMLLVLKLSSGKLINAPLWLKPTKK
jgi:hypothetical protein